jgi:cytochrome P450
LSTINTPGKKVVFSDEILQDPYPTYARMHEEGPLHYVDVGSKWAVWSIFSHAECSSIAKDPRLSAKRAQQMLLPLPLSRQSDCANFSTRDFRPRRLKACVRKSRLSLIEC